MNSLVLDWFDGLEMENEMTGQKKKTVFVIEEVTEGSKSGLDG